MRNNKLVAIVLALLVCLTLVVSASATSSNELTFALVPSGTSVEGIGTLVNAGETFTVDVNITDCPADFNYAEFTLDFNPNEVKLTDVEINNVELWVGKKGWDEGVVTFRLGDINDALMSLTPASKDVKGTIAKLTFEAVSSEDVASVITIGSIDTAVNAEGKDLPVNVGPATMSIASENHVCSAEKTIDANNRIDPTCSTAGKESDMICAVCAKVVIEGKEIETTTHTWNEGVVSQKPTCTAEGEMTKTCVVCHATMKEKIPATGHTEAEPKKENVVAPGCTTEGKYDNVVYCADCGVKLSSTTEKVAATGHSWDKGTVSLAPTCTTVGETTITCTVCKASYVAEEKIPATGHDWGTPFISKPATCTEEGEYSVTCAHCGETAVTEEKLAATGHNMGNGVITVKPDCTTGGERTFTCTVCGYKEVDTNVPATGHAFGEFVENKAPTVEEEGEKTSTCANCGVIKSEPIEKLPEPAKSNVALIVGIIAAVVLVGAGCAAFFVLKNKKK